MKTSVNLRKLTPAFLYGIKKSIVPALLIQAGLAVFVAVIMDSVEPSWDFTFQDGVFLAVEVFTVFMLVTILGIAAVSSRLTWTDEKLSGSDVNILGFLIGAAFALLGNLLFAMRYATLQVFLFLSLSSMATIFLVVYSGRKISTAVEIYPERQAVQGKTSMALMGAWEAVKAASTGCGIYAVVDAVTMFLFGESPWPVLEIFSSVLLLGIFLVFTIPFAFAAGLLFGQFLKKAEARGGFTEKQAKMQGALLGLVTATVLFILDGFLCFSYRGVCFQFVTSMAEITHLESYYLFHYFLSWVISAAAGAWTGKRLFQAGSKVSAPEIALG